MEIREESGLPLLERAEAQPRDKGASGWAGPRGGPRGRPTSRLGGDVRVPLRGEFPGPADQPQCQFLGGRGGAIGRMILTQKFG